MIPLTPARAEFAGQLKMGPAWPKTGTDQPLPVGAELVELPHVPGADAIFQVPTYPRMVSDAIRMAATVFGEEAWQPEDFRVLRLSLSYPPIPSFGCIRLELPPAEQA